MLLEEEEMLIWKIIARIKEVKAAILTIDAKKKAEPTTILTKAKRMAAAFLIIFPTPRKIIPGIFKILCQVDLTFSVFSGLLILAAVFFTTSCREARLTAWPCISIFCELVFASGTIIQRRI